MRYKITIEYDGSKLLGWQKQADGPTAQDFLEKAASTISGENIEVQGAGRTDAGVHALGQVAHFDINKAIDSFHLREGLNAILKLQNAPVTVLQAEEVNDEFHARFSATGRGYIYRILNRRAPTALDKDRVWWVPIPLDVKKMQQAATYLLGHHDFTSFRASACQALSPIKTLDKLEITQHDEEIHFCVEARSFLHHQVRNFVGTLKMVGDEHFKPEDIQGILEACDRSHAGVTAPAHGLYLNRVMY